ncbi:MAG: CoA pyrophosphatase [Chloroflexi bacterium]|nr:CoA pyrophosphatase [Chloroflexota bacterium]
MTNQPPTPRRRAMSDENVILSEASAASVVGESFAALRTSSSGVGCRTKDPSPAASLRSGHRLRVTAAIDQIRRRLARRAKAHLTEPGRIPSAVLVVLFEKDGHTHILFTRRTQVVEYHKGQICFPGGGCEEGETRAMTALRESFEEIGLRAEDVELLGELDDIKTQTSHFIVSPFVGRIGYPYEFRPSAIEIDEILELPLDALRDPANWKVEVQDMEDGTKGEVHSVVVSGHVVWGATAKILKQLVDLLGEGPGVAKDGARETTNEHE